MPTYQYREADGRIIERVLPVEERDRYPNRVTVPVAVRTCLARDPGGFGAQVTVGLKDLESHGERHLRQFETESGFSRRQMASIWGGELHVHK